MKFKLLHNFLSPTKEDKSPESAYAFITMLTMKYIQDNQAKTSLIIQPDECEQLSNELLRLHSLGLENTKNYKAINRRVKLLKQAMRDTIKARKLIDFTKELRACFGESTLLISYSQFEKVLDKYKLTWDLLSNYTGAIPNKNILEIANIKNNISEFKYDLNVGNDRWLWKVKKCVNNTVFNSDKTDYLFKLFTKWVSSKNGFIFSSCKAYPSYESCLYLGSLINVNPDIPKQIKEYPRIFRIYIQGTPIKADDMFIACPPDQLKKQSIEFTKEAVDPIVFQFSPYGIVIHSMWGEEAEDKIFEEYKKVNNLLSL